MSHPAQHTQRKGFACEGLSPKYSTWGWERPGCVYCFWEVPESSTGVWVSHLSWLYQRQLPGWRTNPFPYHPTTPLPRVLLSTKVTLPWPPKAQVVTKSLPYPIVPLPFEVIYEAVQALCLSLLQMTLSTKPWNKDMDGWILHLAVAHFSFG